MAHRTTHTNLGKIYSTLLTWSRARLSTLTERTFAATDAEARRHGWQVSITHGGFGRKYRDPRFDSLAACADCLGLGISVPGHPCHICDGTGRITLKGATEPPPSPPSGAPT